LSDYPQRLLKKKKKIKKKKKKKKKKENARTRAHPQNKPKNDRT